MTLACCSTPCKEYKVLETKLGRVEAVVDRIRYSMDAEIEKLYIKELLEMFSPDSGRFTEDINITKNSS